MVGISVPVSSLISLTDDDHFHPVERAEVEGVEYQPARWIDRSFPVFLPYEVCQRAEILFVKFGLKPETPAFFYLYVHGFSLFIVFGGGN